MAYQRKNLGLNENIGDPGPLPPELVGLTDDVLADLTAHLSADACQQLGYTGQGFFPIEDPPAPPQVPATVPMYKVRKYMILNDLLAPVEAALEALPEPNRSLALVDWEYAPNLVVASALALGVKATLGMDDEAYAAAIIAANAIP